MTYRWCLVTVMTYIVSRKINLLPQFWEFSHYSFTKQQFSSMRKKFSLFGEPRTWPIQSHEKSISSHSFENFLTIPLPNSISLQCAKNSAYLESLGQKITKNHEKSISSHSFENFLTIPLPNSSFLQCAKNSAYLESLQHFIWILAKKNFRLGHNRDLINLDINDQLSWIWPIGHGHSFPYWLSRGAY